MTDPTPWPLTEPGRGNDETFLIAGESINMAARNIVIGQKVNPDKITRAKALRRKMTPEEAILWQHLRRNQMESLQFRRQQVIDGYIVDFYCHVAALVVEVDGEIHDQKLESDLERSKALANRGLLVMRFQNFEVRNDLPAVLHQIRQKCRERAR